MSKTPAQKFDEIQHRIDFGERDIEDTVYLLRIARAAEAAYAANRRYRHHKGTCSVCAPVHLGGQDTKTGGPRCEPYWTIMEEAEDTEAALGATLKGDEDVRERLLKEESGHG